MKRSVVSLFCVVAMTGLLSSCSNDSNDKKKDNFGTVNFFHMVTGASTLSLESPKNDRGLGTVSFGSFGPGISLKAQSWDLKAVDVRDEADGSDDVTLLSGANFTVVKDRRSVQALIGDYASNSVQHVSITMAYDEQRGKGDLDGDGIADNNAQYINFASIVSDPTLASLDVYLVDVANCNDLPLPATPTATVSFKSSTTPIRIEEGKTRFCLRVGQNGAEIFNSGEKTLRDYLEQTIILAPFTGAVSSGATSKITAYYFGDSKSDKWLAADSVGQVRVYNALSDCSDLDVSLENADGDVVNLATGQTFKDLSSYEDVSTKSVVWSAIPSCNTGSTIFYGLGQLVNVEDGQSWSVIFFGGGPNSSPEFSSAIAVPEETTIFTNKSSLTFTNAAYVADETKRKPYNIHVTTRNEGVTAASVDIPLLGYAQYGLTMLNAGIKYYVTATDESNNSPQAQTFPLTTEGGENIHLVIHEKVGGGYEIVRLIGEAAASKTTVVADKNTAIADGVDKITLTIQVRDFGGNKITSSSGVVALSTTSTAIVSTPALDNADGSYTAEVTNTVAETVVIDGTLDGDDIPSITLTFN